MPGTPGLHSGAESARQCEFNPPRFPKTFSDMQCRELPLSRGRRRRATDCCECPHREIEEAVSLLDATLNEEEDTDEKLSELAESVINQKAEAAE